MQGHSSGLRRPSRPTGNRAALLTAARQCLVETGYARTTARDVAAAAAVSLGAIGYHFGSVEALLNEALGEATTEVIGRFASLVSAGTGSNVRGVGRAAVGEFGRLLAEQRPLLVGYIEALAQSERVPALRDQLAEQYDSFRSSAATLLAELVGPEAEALGVDPDLIGSVLVALADGLIIQVLLDPGRADLPERIFAAVERLLP